MKLQVCVLALILSLGTGVAGAQSQKPPAKPTGSKAEAMPPELKALIDPDTAEVLKRINSLSPYETPDLRLRQDTVYAIPRWTMSRSAPSSPTRSTSSNKWSTRVPGARFPNRVWI